VKPKTVKLTFRLCICYSSLVCLYNLGKRDFSWEGGGVKYDFVGGLGAFAPSLYVKKGPALLLKG
jgi:hypothetical protein